jgi:RNA polymerase sigma-70 factor (ECF subfamily)
MSATAMQECPFFLYPRCEKAPNNAMPASRKAVTDNAPPVTFEDLLVAVGKSRDRDAFVRLFEHFAPRVKSFLLKAGMTPAQADDLAQETMLTVWRKAPQFNPLLAGASTWIFTVARNRRIDFLRKQGRPEPDPNDPLMSRNSEPAPDAAVSRDEESKAIFNALAKLPTEQADLVRKAFYEDKTHSDIASETGLPLGTVKSRLRLAMERLRQHLGEGYK